MLTHNQIKNIGFASCGYDVQISEFARFYNASLIHLGNHVRIDDFCVLSAGIEGIEIGSFVHIAVYTSLIGKSAIKLGNFCGLSSRVAVYSSSDDYSGESLTNPTVPDNFKQVCHAPVSIERHVIVGCGCVILPGVTLEEGVALGALSLANKDCASFGIYSGVPARRIGERKRDLLGLEVKLIQEMQKNSTL